MRTTLTLDADVAAKVRDKVARTGASMKQVVNVTLRRGFESPGEAELATSFTVQARPMGLRAGLSLDDVSGLLDLLDGPARR